MKLKKMHLQQHICADESKPKITDSEVLVWSLKNANSEYINANNCLQIIIDLCTCSAKDMDLAKVIRSQIDFISNQLSHKSYQTLIHSSNESNSSIASSSDEEVAKCRDNEIENLRNTHNLLRKKYRLLCLMRSDLTNSRCECLEKSPNGSVLTHLRKSEFNFKMWFTHIKVIETKMDCKRLSLPFDIMKPINSNDMNEMTTNMDMDREVRTFQELHPINSSDVGLNYSAHDISLMRSSAVLHQEFDYSNNGNTDAHNTNHFNNDLLPQMTAIEIDQILNN
ncbi:unnamed protein product [Medioppia subpectinata]|uniref:Uncharacterized protein n=1 Tax=Medioppia subpectinata TaxID=1979941 RepID=A0A7R9KGY5_9ACAR|nr:unnamed protein product [Medioppia subpectinata]CAG2102416.1 unnamed protein product [Medioppia subpectinata]